MIAKVRLHEAPYVDMDVNVHATQSSSVCSAFTSTKMNRKHEATCSDFARLYLVITVQLHQNDNETVKNECRNLGERNIEGERVGSFSTCRAADDSSDQISHRTDR